MDGGVIEVVAVTVLDSEFYQVVGEFHGGAAFGVGIKDVFDDFGFVRDNGYLFGLWIVVVAEGHLSADGKTL